MGSLEISAITDEQAELILRCASKVGAVTMGVPGLSSAHSMIRKASVDQPELEEILSAARLCNKLDSKYSAGYTILRNVRAVKQYFKRRAGGVSLALALATADEPLHWLADGSTCYFQYPGLGSIVFTDWDSSAEMVSLGILFGERIVLDYRRGRATWNTSSGNGRVYMEIKLLLTDIKWHFDVGVIDFIVAGREKANFAKDDTKFT